MVEGEVEAAGELIPETRMAVFASGDPVTFTARIDATVMLLGGDPIGERLIEWNLVSSSRERLERAKEDWRHQRFVLPVGDDQEFTPLPEPPPPPQPMS